MNVKVLIVDDQEPFRRAARHVVESTQGFEVVGEAETGESAVELTARLGPDLVLMDVKLPGIDGVESTRRIVARREGVVVLLLSTYEDDDYDARSRECGAAAFIPKSAFGSTVLRESWAAARRV